MSLKLKSSASGALLASTSTSSPLSYNTSNTTTATTTATTTSYSSQSSSSSSASSKSSSLLSSDAMEDACYLDLSSLDRYMKNLTKGVDIACSSEEKPLRSIIDNLLYSCATKSKNDHLRYLLTLTSPPDVNYRSSKDGGKETAGMTALHVSAANNNAEALKMLLDFGADRNLESNDKYTPLELAKRHNSKECVKLLANYFPVKLKMASSQLDCKLKIDNLLKNSRFNQIKIDFKFMQNEYLPLMIQLKLPDLYNAVKTGDDLNLLEEQFLLMQEESNLSTALQDIVVDFLMSLACSEGQVDSLEFLLDKSPEYDGFPGLYLAIGNNRLDVIKRLLQLPDIDVNKCQEGSDVHMRPLIAAVLQGNVQICKILLENGAFVDVGVNLNFTDVNYNYDATTAHISPLMSTPSSDTALNIAINLRDTAMCKLLIVTGKANVNSVDSNSRTPLLNLLQRRDQFPLEDLIHLVGLLLEYGADVNYSPLGTRFAFGPFNRDENNNHQPYVGRNQGRAVLDEIVPLKLSKHTKIIEMLLYSGLDLDSAAIAARDNLLIREAIPRARVLGIIYALYHNFINIDISDLFELTEALL